ncbi:MAG: hypothetical protein PHS64_00315 [Candidatus Omnitrophica bacterium]|nr:hypothetical protein [Candidatus Omnitrophota bacterium]
MKKLSVVAALFSVFCLAGCLDVASKTDTANLALQLAAQRAGYSVAKNNPKEAQIILLVAKGVLSSGDSAEIVKAAIQKGADELVKRYPNDPLLASEIKLITDNIVITGDNAATPEQLKGIVSAFISGVEVAGVK